MNNRRKLLVAFGAGAFAISLASHAQQATKLAKIGVLLPSNPAATAHVMEGFMQGLREHGYMEGQNILVERRYGETNTERLSNLAAELVRLNVDVIVTGTDLAVRVAKQHTKTIPIVMVNSIDPVGTGFVASLARPGGNITGLSTVSPELGGKRLELLKEAVPKISRVAFLWDPAMAGSALEHEEVESAARRLKVDIQFVEVRSAADVDGVLVALAKKRPHAMFIAGSTPALFANRNRIVSFAAESRIPTMYSNGEYTNDGGFMAYGPNYVELYRRAAYFVDKILKNAKPGDIPVEQPTKFELIINRKTAKALGIKIPQSILVQATKVIE